MPPAPERESGQITLFASPRIDRSDALPRSVAVSRHGMSRRTTHYRVRWIGYDPMLRSSLPQLFIVEQQNCSMLDWTSGANGALLLRPGAP